jgi:hypothetical protein
MHASVDPTVNIKKLRPAARLFEIQVDSKSKRLLENAITRLGLSARACDRILNTTISSYAHPFVSRTWNTFLPHVCDYLSLNLLAVSGLF